MEEWKLREDDYYALSQAASAIDIKVPESVKLDNLDDEESFPLPSSFNTNSYSNINTMNNNGSNPFRIKKQISDSSPSFSALAHSWNSPFTFNSTYSGDKNLTSPTPSNFSNTSNSVNNNNKTSLSPSKQPTTIQTSAWNEDSSPTLSLLSTSSTSSKKKILLFSNGLNLQKK